jgi:ADP-ribose pyrophosphatase YjhB (NUDIX family)
VSLNPALEDAKYCPRCGSAAEVSFPRSIRCASCGYGAFYNPKPVACAIPATDDGELYLMRRGFEPSRGLWTMPGGYVDLGESVEDAAIRETKEEIGVDIEITGLVGVYSRSTDRIVVVVYAARAQGTPTRTEEALEVRAFEATTIPWDHLAFWSDGRALRDYFQAAATDAAAASSP